MVKHEWQVLKYRVIAHQFGTHLDSSVADT